MSIGPLRVVERVGLVGAACGQLMGQLAGVFALGKLVPGPRPILLGMAVFAAIGCRAFRAAAARQAPRSSGKRKSAGL